MDKAALREHFKGVRASIPADERTRIDLAIARHVLDLPAYHRADTLLSYVSYDSEVDTRELINQAWRDDKRVALPRVVPGMSTMRWYVAYSLKGLETSPFGIDEPPANPDCELDFVQAGTMLALVPGLAFDKQGYRLGYGGGYYDVFLRDFAGTSVGLCRSVQLVDRLECRDAHDVPVDLLITA